MPTPITKPLPDDWLEVVRLSSDVRYEQAYAHQIQRRDAIQRGESPDALLICEHPPTITLGRNSHEHHLLQSRDNLTKMGIDVVEVDRGGDVTYHGPGQLVAYPILNLERWKPSVSWYLRELEQVLIDVLNDFGLKGERLEKHTGVWVAGAKVAAVGVGIHKWVSYHGISINVAPNMNHWALIVPCGIPDKPVTSLERLLGEPPPMADLMQRFEERFRLRFGPSRQQLT